MGFLVLVSLAMMHLHIQSVNKFVRFNILIGFKKKKQFFCLAANLLSFCPVSYSDEG